MAWPVDARHTDFVVGTVFSPVFGNAFQDKIIGLYAGTLSVKGVVADTTGGQVVSTPAGTGKFGGVAVGASYARGLLGKEMIPVAFGTVSLSNPTCSVLSGYNLSGASRSGTGTYNVTFTSAVPYSGNQPGMASGLDGNTRGIPTLQACTTGTGGAQVYMFNSAGALTDPSSAMTTFVIFYALV